MQVRVKHTFFSITRHRNEEYNPKCSSGTYPLFLLDMTLFKGPAIMNAPAMEEVEV